MRTWEMIFPPRSGNTTTRATPLFKMIRPKPWPDTVLILVIWGSPPPTESSHIFTVRETVQSPQASFLWSREGAKEYRKNRRDKWRRKSRKYAQAPNRGSTEETCK